MSSKLDEIRLIVMGDSHVGKTSMIMSLVSESYTESVPAVLHTVSVPADWTPHNIALTICDTSSQHTVDILYKQYIQHYIQHNVGIGIVLVCSSDNQQSIERITSYWIPQLDKYCTDIPITIAINKSANNNSHTKQFQSLLDSYRVFSVTDCSAKHIYDISDVFWQAQTAVIAPITPLLDTSTLRLKSMFIKALYRIFKLFANSENLIDNTALNKYQQIIYKRPLQVNAMNDIITLLNKHNQNSNLLQDNQLTFDGFCEMSKQIILNKRTDTIWYALQCFGYNRLLQIDDIFVKLNEFKSAYTIEFNEYGIQYLIDIFKRNVPCGQLTIQHSNDNTSTPNALQRIFKAASEIPFALQSTQYIQTCNNSTADIDIYGWLSHWSMLLTYNTTLALKQLLYIGIDVLPSNNQSFIESTHIALRKCITILPSRVIDNRLHTVQRNVVSCMVAGSAQCGKSTFIACMLNKSSIQTPPTTPTLSSIKHNSTNAVTNTAASNRVYAQAIHAIQYRNINDANATLPMAYLLLKELSSQHTKSTIKSEYNKHDLLILLYDSTSTTSFQFVTELLNTAYNLHIPTVIVCTKIDAVPNGTSQLINDYTQCAYDLQFLGFSAKQYYTQSIQKQLYSTELLSYPIIKQSSNIYEYLHNGANQPNKHLPINKLLRLRRRTQLLWLVLGSSLLTITTIGAILFKRHLDNKPLIDKQWFDKLKSQLKRNVT